MQHLETATSPFGPHRGEKEQTVSAPIPLMTGTALSHIPGIPTSTDNLFSYVRVDNNGNMLVVLTD